MSPVRHAATAPHQSVREERINSLTHGIGLVLSLIGWLVLLMRGAVLDNPWLWASGALYGTTLVFLYGASTFYHSVRHPRLKYLARVADHIGIYLLIAGTYTPFLVMLGLRDPLGWGVLAVVWSCTIAGLLFKVYSQHRFHWGAVVPYVVLGWVGIFCAEPLIEMLSWEGFSWLVAGGVSYTGGVVFFGWHRIPFNHGVWHLFVLSGSAIHYAAVLQFVMA
jgi:hemolysin III